jgi:hypothetical protein
MLRYGNAFYSYSSKTYDMNNQNQDAKNVRTNPHASQSGGKRPENKDNLDSRKNEEQDTKGDDVTHNEKEVESEKAKRPHRK